MVWENKFSNTDHSFELAMCIRLRIVHNSYPECNRDSFPRYRYNFLGWGWQRKIHLYWSNYSYSRYSQRLMMWRSWGWGSHKYYNIEQIGRCIQKPMYIPYNSFQLFFLVIFSWLFHIQDHTWRISQRVSMLYKIWRRSRKFWECRYC